MKNDNETNDIILAGGTTPLSPEALASLGMPDLAYVKRIEIEGDSAYAVHAADGSPLAVLANRDLAFAAARQNELEPVSVH